MPKKNINNFPVIKETSLHRIVKRVKNNDDTLLTDPKTGKYVKTSDYLGADVDDRGKVTIIYVKKPFYWECWDFNKDVNVDENMVRYDFAINFSGIEIGFINNSHNDRRIYFSNYIAFRYVIFSGMTDLYQAIFSGKTDFKNATFFGKVNFENATFSSRTNFSDAAFSGKANFENITFYEKVNFKNATFSNDVNFWCAIFTNWANFENVTFLKRVNFWNATFSNDVNFQYATFSSMADFWDATFSNKADFLNATFSNKADFENATFSNGVYMTDLKFNSKKLFIDFTNCTIENKIIFGLSEDNADAYEKLIFCLYCSNINYFICDDKTFEHTRLYWDDPIGDNKELEKKTKIERNIHEMRVMRKIFQDLLWGDVADKYYGRLMDKQLKLELYELWRDYPKFLISMNEFFNQPIHKIDKRLLSKKSNYIKYLKGLLSKKILLTLLILLKKVLFRKCFGWGVKLINIFSTGFAIILVFSALYLPQKIDYYVGSGEIINNTQYYLHSLLFSVWTFFNIFLPDLQVTAFNSSTPLFLVTAESLMGIIWMTLLVAILARKFMRL